MRKLYNFLIENLVFEAHFESNDFKKHDYKYRDGVINSICYNGIIKLGKNGEQTFEIDETTRNLVRQEFDNYKPQSAEEFNNIMNKYNLPNWREIWKGMFSSKVTDTDGQWAESLICYIYNNGEDKKDNWLKSHNFLSPAWVDSSIETAKFINKYWSNEEYIICHTDAKDYDLNNFDFAKEITRLFQGKKEMQRIFKVNCNDLYSGSKDSWNKSDVVLIHKELGKTVIEDMKQVVVDGASINNYLISLAKDQIVIPISLKMLDKHKPIHLSTVNLDETNSTNLIKTVKYLRFANRYSNEYTGNVDIVCDDDNDNEILITFRSDTNGLNGLNIEPKSKSGGYRFGKSVNVLKSIFGLKTAKDCYIYADSNEHAISILEDYGFRLENLPKRINDIKPPLYERACIAGLLGILNEYKNKKFKGTKEELLINFCNFILMCSTGNNSPGGFYKISN